MAEGLNKKSVAGVAVMKSPPGFKEAMAAYLQRLGRRRDFVVLVIDEQCRQLLEDAGYQAEPAPPASQLVPWIARSDHPVLGIVVSGPQEVAYSKAANDGGLPDSVFVIDYLEELDELLTKLDEKL